MGTVPHGGGKDKFHLLSTGKTADLAVGSKLLFQTKVIQMPLDLSHGAGTKVETSLLGSNLLVGLFEKLFKDKGYALLTVCAVGFLLAFFTANYFLLGGSVTGGLMGSGDRG